MHCSSFLLLYWHLFLFFRHRSSTLIDELGSRFPHALSDSDATAARKIVRAGEQPHLKSAMRPWFPHILLRLASLSSLRLDADLGASLEDFVSVATKNAALTAPVARALSKEFADHCITSMLADSTDVSWPAHPAEQARRLLDSVKPSSQSSRMEQPACEAFDCEQPLHDSQLIAVSAKIKQTHFQSYAEGTALFISTVNRMLAGHAAEARRLGVLAEQKFIAALRSHRGDSASWCNLVRDCRCVELHVVLSDSPVLTFFELAGLPCHNCIRSPPNRRATLFAGVTVESKACSNALLYGRHVSWSESLV